MEIKVNYSINQIVNNRPSLKKKVIKKENWSRSQYKDMSESILKEVELN
jgi:hypothetical protein